MRFVGAMANKRIRSLLALAAAPVSVYSLDVLSPPTNSSEPAVSSLSSDISTSITSPELPPTTSQPSTPSDGVPSSPIETTATPTITLPPSLASATTCLSSWSSWSSAVTAYTGPYSSGTYSLITPAVTLTGHLYYTTPAPATYSAPECTFADADICAVLASDGVQIIGSAPTTVVVPATTDVLEGDVPAEVLLPSPACSVGQAACSALASTGVVDGFWDGWVVDWRDCVMEPPGIGPVALTTTDFLVAPPTGAVGTTRTTGKTTTGGGRSGSSSPRPTSTKAEVSSGGSGYLVSETDLLPGTATGKPEDGKGGGGVVAASQVVAAPADAQGPHTIDLVISTPNNGGAPPSSTCLTLPPPPVTTRTDPIPVATLAGQTIVYDPAKGAPSAVYVGDFPVREGGPAVNVGDTPVRLLPGGLLLVGAGGKSGSPTTTITLPAAAATAMATDDPIATIAGMPVYADPARPGAVIVGGETLAPGASVVLDDGKTVWLGGVDGATGDLQLEQVAETMGTGDGAGVTGSSALEATVTAGGMSGGTTSRSNGGQGGSVTATSGRNGTVTTSRTTTATTSGDGLEGYTAVPSIPSSTLDVDSSGIRVWTRKVGALFAGLVVAGRMLV